MNVISSAFVLTQEVKVPSKQTRNLIKRNTCNMHLRLLQPQPQPTPSQSASCMDRRTMLSKSSSILSMSTTQHTGSSSIYDEVNEGGIYRPFANYAWDKLHSSGLFKANNDNVGDESSGSDNVAMSDRNLLFNSSPAKGSPEGTVVNINIQRNFGREYDDDEDDNDNTGDGGSLRVARYALLETMNEKDMVSLDSGIHVLNLVLFPQVSNSLNIALPILGMDLVTLPGGKHLIAIDFQPILPIEKDSSDNDDDNEERKLFQNGNKYAKYEERIKEIHSIHVLKQSDVVPWGGDIPPKASRFFSNYALWTRLQGDEGLKIIRNEVYHAFCAYFDLYLELLLEVQQDNLKGERETSSDDEVQTSEAQRIIDGQRDYIFYRRENDPARPMLNRLYGNEWADEVISKLLFQMI